MGSLPVDDVDEGLGGADGGGRDVPSALATEGLIRSPTVNAGTVN
jgi:hypothetical protein